MADSKIKILIIEDEEVLSDVLDSKLKKEGYETNLAADGEDGFNKIKKWKPDMILLDIIMPKMGGFEVMEKINKDPELKKIPVIVISNSGQPVEIDKAQRLGAKDWLIKTEFDPQEVLNKVVKQIGK